MINAISGAAGTEMQQKAPRAASVKWVKFDELICLIWLDKFLAKIRIWSMTEKERKTLWHHQEQYNGD